MIIDSTFVNINRTQDSEDWIVTIEAKEGIDTSLMNVGIRVNNFVINIQNIYSIKLDMATNQTIFKCTRLVVNPTINEPSQSNIIED